MTHEELSKRLGGLKRAENNYTFDYVYGQQFNGSNEITHHILFVQQGKMQEIANRIPEGVWSGQYIYIPYCLAAAWLSENGNPADLDEF